MKAKDNAVNIFLVDDDNVQLELVKRQLDQEFKDEVFIRKFKSMEECTAQLRRKPQIVVLDYFLGTKSNGPTGIELLKEIKKFSPETFVIMVSGQNQIEVAANTIKYGAFDYIPKNKSEFSKIKRTVGIALDQIYAARKLKSFKLFVIAIAVLIIAMYLIRQNFGS